MRSVPLSEFRAHAAAMIARVEQGESLCILRHGKPVAEIVPPRPVVLKVPAWRLPVEPLKYLRQPEKTGAQLIIDEREGGW